MDDAPCGRGNELYTKNGILIQYYLAMPCLFWPTSILEEYEPAVLEICAKLFSKTV
jgi:hypothetical protein